MFGAFGYFFCSLLWFWAVILYFSVIKAFALFFSPTVNNNVTKSATAISPGPGLLPIIVVFIVTAIMVLVTLYVIIKMPSTLAKVSKKIVHEAADGITPLVLRVQHKKDIKKNHIKLTSGLVIIMKIVLIFTPVVLTFASKFLEQQIFNFYIALYISLWLAGCSAIFFIFQYLFANLLSVKMKDLW
ncbi:MAG TPA: hypothetical protein VMR16_04080 [Candidatus Saccharimonadales bacterium]|nr:hypothetical protein [Candidatus Saccharimonadales bacterium]